MIEIIIHGRGGQGGKKLSKMIAQAAFIEGKQVQSFALYGAERRGAPVVSFVRIDDEPIELRGYVTKPDFTIVLDDSLLNDDMVNVLVNTSTVTGCETIDATKIAMNIIGRNIVNTTMLGAFASSTGIIDILNACEAIEISLPDKIVQKNIDACLAGYDSK